MKKVLISMVIVVLTVGCKKNDNQPNLPASDSTAQIKNDSITINQSVENKDQSLKQINDEVLQALKNKDYKNFASFIHPQKGIRFSMYAFVDVKGTNIFPKLILKNTSLRK